MWDFIKKHRITSYFLIFYFSLSLVSCGFKDKIESEEFLNNQKVKTLNWTTEDTLPLEGRNNPFHLDSQIFFEYQKQGQIHTQSYPVEITGVLLPEQPIKNILDNKTWNPIKAILNNVFKSFVNVDDFSSLFEWVGLLDYPEDLTSLPFAVPDILRRGDRIGYTRVVRNGVDVFTMSCATCHSDQLFGTTVLGMTKRFPRANEFFIKGHEALGFYSSFMFKLYTGASREEMFWLERSIDNLKSVGFKQPLTLGLDTSLAQVALSLKKRKQNEWADKSSYYEKNPRADYLDTNPGDSKPAVWWNVKFKNRWLSDGSVISGNPIYTNLLWNEIGRGTDLRELGEWLDNNEQIIKELTTAVFSIEAPRIENFFEADKIPQVGALKGEKIFNQTCSKCHGVYEKKWSLDEFKKAPWTEQIQTWQVRYPQPTQVVDVGTDPYRYLSMKSLEALNDLAISKKNNIKIQSQKGYVPPPLVGIWARWPYMHNNSIPDLCSLLTPSKHRPQSYYAVMPIDPERDFDFECNGYPKKPEREWVEQDKIYKTSQKGLSAVGHDEGIFVQNGKEILTSEDKKNLIYFLQTL